MKFKLSQLPWLIIVIGILFTFYLQFQVPQGVFFSGDAGLKALLAQQLSSGQLHFNLIPPDESWINQLWQNDFYPYEPPFVYSQNDHYYITFPFTFPLITAPFQALFGYRGLYIVPLVSTWIIWLIFVEVCEYLNIKDIYTSLGLIILIFASPLTIYSAIYWEHTLAVALAFAGFRLLFFSTSGLSKVQTIISGFLIGLAVWFRPEFLCFAAILIVLVYLSSWSQADKLQFIKEKFNLQQIAYLGNNKILFTGSIIITIGLFFLCNKLIYDHPLGIHAIQIVEESSVTSRLQDGWQNFKELGVALFIYFPLAFFPLIYLPLSWLSREKIEVKDIIIYKICFFFLLGTALIVPVGTAGLIPGGKQWGTRFLLILIPLISLLISRQLNNLEQYTSKIKYLNFIVIGLLLIIGLSKNIYGSTTYLQTSYQGIRPAIEFIKEQDTKNIAISHQFIAQVIQPALPSGKIFFQVENREKLIKFSSELLKQNQKEFLYICYPFRKCQVTEENHEQLTFTQNSQNYRIKLLKLGKFGKYPIYKLKIQSVSESE